MLKITVLAGAVALALMPTLAAAVEAPATVRGMLDAARQAVPQITAAAAQAMLAEGRAVLIDVRDAPEVADTGRIAGAHHIPRGMLEFRADPATAYYDPVFDRERAIVLYCASGARSALAARTLQEMGYTAVYNLGGFQDAVTAGFAVDRNF